MTDDEQTIRDALTWYALERSHDSPLIAFDRLVARLAARERMTGWNQAKGRCGMSTMRTGDVKFVIAGWWVRLLWGVTFKPKRFRKHSGFGFHMIAVRLWRSRDCPMDGRLVGIQWRRTDGAA